MAVRSAIKKTGYTVNTLQEIQFRAGGRATMGDTLAQGKRTFEYETADYIADATRPPAGYRIEAEHEYGNTDYLWDVIKTENNGNILVVDYHKGEDVLMLWFVSDAKDIKVTVMS